MLLKFLGKYRDLGLLVLRLGLGIAYIIQGLPKLAAGPKMWYALGAEMSHLGIHHWLTFWGFLNVAIRGLGGLLLIPGFLYRPICLLLSFTMVVAALTMAHHVWTIDAFNQVLSHPMKMAVVFFGLAFIGPGRFSIDKD